MLTAISIWLILVVIFASTGLRWLRVAQREHYEPLRVSRIALLWYQTSVLSLGLALLAGLALIASFWWPPSAVVTGALVAFIPVGLSIRGSTAKLRFTGRLNRLAGIILLFSVGIILLTGDYRTVAVLAFFAPAVIDAALLIAKPLESLFARRFVRRAQETLRRVHPITVAITGSYGKTTTKFYAESLLQRYRATLASPASFNNLLGLSRAVNQGLRPGIEVFIAEMGTYGKGEISRLCDLFPPDISVITTIGEAHLERMASRKAIFEAKSEIVERAATIVLNVDVPELADLATQLEDSKRVIRCSVDSDAQADIRVAARSAEWVAEIKGQGTLTVLAPETGHPINFGLAVGIVLAVRGREPWISTSSVELPSVSHRAEVTRMADGVTVVDDTYNANPDGAASALALSRQLGAPYGNLWVVTPGMIELGANQDARNEEFAKSVAEVPTATLLIVGRTNRKPLQRGAPDSSIIFSHHAAAVKFASANSSKGDVILYENQLPDHYP